MNHALLLDPANAPAVAYKGALLAEAGDVPGATAALKDALNRAPANADVLRIAIPAFDKLHMVDEEIALQSQLVVSQPGKGEWLNNRCWTKAINGRNQNDALADCNAALTLDKDSAAALDSRGFVHLKLNRFKDAIADYSAALKLRPAQPTSLFGRGFALLHTGNAIAAQQDLAAARKIDPGIDKQFAGYGVRL